jgi:hypothetical protein
MWEVSFKEIIAQRLIANNGGNADGENKGKVYLQNVISCSNERGGRSEPRKSLYYVRKKLDCQTANACDSTSREHCLLEVNPGTARPQVVWKVAVAGSD